MDRKGCRYFSALARCLRLLARRPGFTLVELLIVIALIALIGMFALPTVSNYFSLSLNSVTRELATLVKESYNSAALTGRVHRIVFDLDESRYWVESGPPDILLHTETTLEREREKEKWLSTKAKANTPKEFRMEDSITRKELSLPRGVEFKKILTSQLPEPIEEGRAYVHFFPHGISEQSIIYLEDAQEHRMALVLAPIVGRTKLYKRFIDPEEVFVR